MNTVKLAPIGTASVIDVKPAGEPTGPKLLKGSVVAAEIREDIKKEVEQLKKDTGVVPGLVTILMGNNPASESYVRSKNKTAQDLGFHSVQENLPANTTEAELLAAIKKYNEDSTIHGILVQLPLPKGISEEKVLLAIDPTKDVDGFHPTNVGKLLIGNPSYIPCTPYGIVELLARSGAELKGAEVVVVGRSNIVGKPIAALLMQKTHGNATVTVVHTATKDLISHTKRADIIIAAAGVTEYVRGDWIKEGAVIIDVGVNEVGKTESGKRILKGDVHFEECAAKASAITPVPGGVGPMTITMLMKNTLQAAKIFAENNRPKLLKGSVVAAEIRETLKKEAEELKASTGVVPGLVTILIGNNPASESYVRSKNKTAKELGYHSIQENLDANITEVQLLECIQKYNADPSIHGILVQLPLPKGINEEKVLLTIDPKKDVDGFHPTNVGKLLIGNPSYIPCTPYGIVELLMRSGATLKGAEVVVVGRSNIVGKPIAALLMQKCPHGNATVTVCHTSTRNIKEHCLRADIIIAAVGVTEYVKGDWIKPGAVVIDVGVNEVGKTESGKRILKGDVAFDECAAKASAITPVPGGVGPMTITMLMKNTLAAAKIAASQK